MSLPTNLEDLNGYLRGLVNEEASQVKRRAQLLAEVETLQQRIGENQRQANALRCDGFRGSSGSIPKLQLKIAEVKRAIEDFDKPLVVWKSFGSEVQAEPTAYPTGRYGSAIEVPFVIEKITPKRIFVREKGGTRTSQYERSDGTNIGSYKQDQIDLKKTFPEGLPS